MSDGDQDVESQAVDPFSTESADDLDDELSFDDDGAVSFDNDESTEDDALHQSEIDDIFGIGMDEEESITGLEALLNNTNILHVRMPLLEACITQLIRALKKSMRNFTSDNVELSLVETKSVRFGNYIEAVPIPTFISIFSIVEWDNYGIINIDSPMVYSILDALLGGRKAGAPLAVEGRSFTAIEVTLIQRFVELILKEMATAFLPIAKVEFRHERMESNPSLATIAYPADSAVLFSIDVDMDNRGGHIEILIPYPTLEPVRHLLRQMFMGDKSSRHSIWQDHWVNELQRTDVELEVSLGEVTALLSEIMSLEVGSTLSLGKNPKDLVVLRCGDANLLRGRVGRVGEKMAVRVEDWVPNRKNEAQI